MAELAQVMNEETSLCPDVVFKKANVMVSAKYKSSLLENKILAVALSRITVDSKNMPIAEIKVSEMKGFLNIDGNSIYERLKTVAKQMSGRIVFMENAEKTHWEMQSIIVGADYEKNTGKLKVFFNPNLISILYDLRISYTKYCLPLLLSFNSGYSYRLYELLKSKAYRPKGSNIQGPYTISYGLNELKLTIGLVNTDTDKVKQAMQDPNPDFDYIVEHLAIEKTFDKWYDFKRYVLDVAVDEINTNPMSDILIQYETVKVGRGGKIKNIIFTVIKKEDIKEIVDDIHEPGAEKLMELVEEIQENIDIPLKIKDIKSLLKAAEYNTEKVLKVYDMAKKKKNIHNVIGWMLEALKNNYEEHSVKKKNSFNDFEQRDYDFEQLEMELLSKK